MALFPSRFASGSAFSPDRQTCPSAPACRNPAVIRTTEIVGRHGMEPLPPHHSWILRSRPVFSFHRQTKPATIKGHTLRVFPRVASVRLISRIAKLQGNESGLQSDRENSIGATK